LTAQEVAEQGAERARSGHPDLSVHAVSVTGSVPTMLAGLSAGADLLVVGHRGHGGFAGLRPGSVALRTVTRAGCPAVVVRGAGHGTRGTVVAAVDVGDSADEILEFAFAEAARRKSRLKVIGALEILWPWAYAGDRGELGAASAQTVKRAGAALEGLLEPWRAKYPEVVVDCELEEGAPAGILTTATTYADLIVVGARRRGVGHHGVGHHGDGHHGVHLGPIAHTLLMHADCSVAVVPHR
jgi:nucleotide-binding universal stress UspA family protein